eukprot:TRINITY_DN23956_c0_g1_i2.p2 TRINITY_DN23956_c0_g1~~TRINITY_DN23956_c0_g1_i2.p2  ORF type:complete len:113 (-),score=18.85 TRINITY_DN23956_c0_g1_i2:245-583(-)
MSRAIPLHPLSTNARNARMSKPKFGSIFERAAMAQSGGTPGRSNPSPGYRSARVCAATKEQPKGSPLLTSSQLLEHSRRQTGCAKWWKEEEEDEDEDEGPTWSVFQAALADM